MQDELVNIVKDIEAIKTEQNIFMHSFEKQGERIGKLESHNMIAVRDITRLAVQQEVNLMDLNEIKGRIGNIDKQIDLIFARIENDRGKAIGQDKYWNRFFAIISAVCAVIAITLTIILK